jgi:ADP-ribose pyrophosphatase
MTKGRRPRLLARDVVFDGRVIRVERDRVALGRGQTANMEVVRHRGSVVLIPQPSAGEVILIRQYRYVIDRSIWELPAGTLERGESPPRAARRECEEETGLRPRRIVRLGSLYPTPGFCDERMTFYRCEQLFKPSRARSGDADEVIEPRTFSLAAAWKLVDREEIIDMKTVLGLLLCERR